MRSTTGGHAVPRAADGSPDDAASRFGGGTGDDAAPRPAGGAVGDAPPRSPGGPGGADASPGPAGAPLAWTDAFVLGHEPIDATHREFVELVSALQTAPDDRLPALLAEFEAHARRHFGDEDRWMRETAFPPRDCHIDEHAAVLRSIEEVRAHVAATGDAREARRLADALAGWFPGHADWLDSALAHWLCKRAYGGKPVVVRRDLAAARRTGADPDEGGRDAGPDAGGGPGR